jgi:hypothetical protein
LANELKLAREPLVLETLESQAGMIGFFQYKTHFGGHREAASGASERTVFCGGGRDTPDKLRRDHSSSKFRAKIVK